MDKFVITKANQLKKKYATNDPFNILKELGVHVQYNYDFKHLKAFYYIMLGIPYVVINGALEEAERRTVAAHELGHHIFHRQLAKTSPFREIGFYDMKSTPEYEANLFASELLIDEEDLIMLLKEESDYFKICSVLEVCPELMAFKINNMNKKGCQYKIPITYKSDFLAK